MPTASSRTPDGQPGRCPVCGADVTVDPAEPLGDAPCPACGVLIWPLDVGGVRRWIMADEYTPEQRERFAEIIRRAKGGDSLDWVDVIMELDEAIGLNIPDDVAVQFETIDEFLDWFFDRRDEDL